MKKILTLGLIIGFIVSAWFLSLVIARSYTNTVLTTWVVLGLEFIGMIWILRKTAEGNGYWQRVKTGILVFAVVAVVLFFFTYFGWAVLDPNYADTFVEAARQNALNAGRTAEEIAPKLEELRAMYTPIRQSFFTFVGTVATGVVFSLGIAVFFRQK